MFPLTLICSSSRSSNSSTPFFPLQVCRVRCTAHIRWGRLTQSLGFFYSRSVHSSSLYTRCLDSGVGVLTERLVLFSHHRTPPLSLASAASSSVLPTKGEKGKKGKKSNRIEFSGKAVSVTFFFFFFYIFPSFYHKNVTKCKAIGLSSSPQYRIYSYLLPPLPPVNCSLPHNSTFLTRLPSLEFYSDSRPSYIGKRSLHISTENPSWGRSILS